MRSSCLLIFLLLTACDTSDSETIEEFAATVEVEDEQLRVMSDELDVSVPRQSVFDHGTFKGGASGVSITAEQVIAVSETNDTYAALLRNTDDIVTGKAFFGRHGSTFVPDSGQATLTGSYIGTFEESIPTFEAYIRGDAELVVAFADMTLSGSVTNRNGYLLGLDSGAGPLIFDFSTDIIFEKTSISGDGTFFGNVSVIDRIPDGDEPGSGRFQGVLGGVDATEAVGRIVTEQTETSLPIVPVVSGGFFATTERTSVGVASGSVASESTETVAAGAGSSDVLVSREIGVFAVGH